MSATVPSLAEDSADLSRACQRNRRPIASSRPLAGRAFPRATLSVQHGEQIALRRVNTRPARPRNQMDPIEKAVMDAYIAAATRKESASDCLCAAIETWIALNPGADIALAAPTVNRMLARLRLVDDEAALMEISPDDRERVVAAWRRAQAIGLHPDNCLARAIEAWLEWHPGDDRPTAERRVSRIIEFAGTAP